MAKSSFDQKILNASKLIIIMIYERMAGSNEEVGMCVFLKFEHFDFFVKCTFQTFFLAKILLPWEHHIIYLSLSRVQVKVFEPIS